MPTTVVAATGSRSHALMACVAWLALLFMLLHAVVQGAAETVLIGGNRVEHVGRVMSCGLEPRGEPKNNSLTGGVRANTPDARKKELSEVTGNSKNSGRTALLFTIGTLVPLSLLAIWVLRRMRRRPSGPVNDPEHQVDEHCPAAYPLRLVSPPPSSPLGPGSTITPPPPAHHNGRNKQLPETKTSYTSSLTSIGTPSTAPAETREAEVPYLPSLIFVRLKSKHEETNRMRAGGGEGGSHLPLPIFTRLRNKHQETNRMGARREARRGEGPPAAAEMGLTGVGMPQPAETLGTQNATH